MRLVPRVLKAGSDLQQGKLGFWGQNLLREEEAKDWHARLDSLKKFTESLAPYNTVGKLKNLRVTQEDLDGQKKNLDDPGCRRASARTGGRTGQHGVLPLAGRDGVARRAPVGEAGRDRPQDAAGEAEPGPHSRARRRIPADAQPAQEGLHHRLHRQPQQGAAGRGRDKTRNALRKDDRLLALRVLAGVSLMPTSQLTAFEESLNGLKSFLAGRADPGHGRCLPALPVPPVCRAVGADPGGQPPAQAGRRSGSVGANWQQTLLENLEDPFTRTAWACCRPRPKADRRLPDLAQAAGPDDHRVRQRRAGGAVGAGKIAVKGDEIKQALLQGGSPATPDDLRKRFGHIHERALQGQGCHQAALRDQ